MTELRIPGDVRVRIEQRLGYISDVQTIANYMGIPRAWVEHTARNWKGRSTRACDRGNGQAVRYSGPTQVEIDAPKKVIKAGDDLLRRHREVFAAHARRTGRPIEDCVIMLMNCVMPTKRLATTTFVVDTDARKEAS